jgi:hypothetical protein
MMKAEEMGVFLRPLWLLFVNFEREVYPKTAY